MEKYRDCLPCVLSHFPSNIMNDVISMEKEKKKEKKRGRRRGAPSATTFLYHAEGWEAMVR